MLVLFGLLVRALPRLLRVSGHDDGVKDLEILRSAANFAAIALQSSVLAAELAREALLRQQMSRLVAPNLVEQIVQGKLSVERQGATRTGGAARCGSRGRSRRPSRERPRLAPCAARTCDRRGPSHAVRSRRPRNVTADPRLCRFARCARCELTVGDGKDSDLHDATHTPRVPLQTI